MRIQLDIDEKGAQILELVKQKTGLKTHKELFNNAVTLLDWAVKQRHAGRIIASLDESKQEYKELQMPALEHAKPALIVEEPPAAASATAHSQHSESDAS